MIINNQEIINEFWCSNTPLYNIDLVEKVPIEILDIVQEKIPLKALVLVTRDTRTEEVKVVFGACMGNNTDEGIAEDRKFVIEHGTEIRGGALNDIIEMCNNEKDSK